MARRVATIIVGILLVFPATGWAQAGLVRVSSQVPIIGGPFFDARRPIAVLPRIGFARTTPIIIGPQDAPYPYSVPYPYFAPAPFYSTPIYYSEPSYVTAPVVESPVVTHNDTYYDTTSVVLSNQVQQLTQEVERLQQVVESQRPAVQAAPAPQTPPTPTVLVFRDGRQMQVMNYAISGQTLLVLDPGATSRISTSDLDLPATQRENRARGVRFPS